MLTKPIIQAVEYQKLLFSNTYSLLSVFSDQNRTMVDKLFENETIFPKPTRQVYSFWSELMKQNSTIGKDFVEDSLDKFKNLFEEKVASPSKPKSAKASE